VDEHDRRPTRCVGSLDLLRFQAAHATRQPTEWWIRADDAAAAGAVDPTTAGAFARATVLSRIDRTASLSADPLALGIIGALALGFVVAGLFAVIGLAASAAVSAVVWAPQWTIRLPPQTDR